MGIEYKLVAIAQELEAMKRHRKSLEEQQVLRLQIADQQKTLMEMRQSRERGESEKMSQPERSQLKESQGKWFGDGRIPTEREFLDSKNRAEMLSELDDLLRRER